MPALQTTKNEISTSICDEQCNAVLQNLPLSLIVNCILAASVAFLIYGSIDFEYIILWTNSVAALCIFRHILVFSDLPKFKTEHGSSYKLSICSAGALLSGLLWAVVPICFIDYSADQASYVSIILCGLTAGAAVQGSSYAPPVIAVAMPVLGSMIAKVGLLGTSSGYILTLDLVMYLAVIVRGSIVGEHSFVKTVIVKLEARGLSERLKVEHATSQAAAARFRQLANHDALTGVANRACFDKTLSDWLNEASRDHGEFLLFLVDLDHFKSINDTLGHRAGDEVICEVARRLSTKRSKDRFVARLGGDEFAVLVRVEKQTLGEVAEGILASASGPLQLEGRSVEIELSIGVAAYPADGTTAEALTARSDLALYAAKDKGRRCWQAFDLAMVSAADLDRDVGHDLPIALADGGLEVWWQPQMGLDDGRLTGLEGLLRWRHPVHGWIAPPRVVAAALRTRRSEMLTGFVLGKACSMLARLEALGRDDVVVAVNISPSEILQYDLPALVRRSIDAAGIDPSRLALEVTEETILSNDQAIAALNAIERSGVRISIDDFGAGYASFAYLRTLRVEQIKIDRSFVTGLRERDGDRVLVQAIVGLGRSLGIEVVAEGVETVDDVLVLRHMGCRVAQGYYYGAARPEAELQFGPMPDREKREQALVEQVA